MKTFTVECSRTEFFYVTVRANEEQEAREAAIEVICNSDDPWEQFGDRSDGFETTDCNVTFEQNHDDIAEAAVCLWEQIIHPTYGTFPLAISACNEEGWSAVRATILGWAGACDLVYREAINLGYDDSFDWEFCPLFLSIATNAASDGEVIDNHLRLNFDPANHQQIRIMAEKIVAAQPRPENAA